MTEKSCRDEKVFQIENDRIISNLRDSYTSIDNASIMFNPAVL